MSGRRRPEGVSRLRSMGEGDTWLTRWYVVVRGREDSGRFISRPPGSPRSGSEEKRICEWMQRTMGPTRAAQASDLLLMGRMARVGTYAGRVRMRRETRGGSLGEAQSRV